MVQCPSDASAEEIPSGDLETAKHFGKRVSEIAAKLRS
jgi:NAD(P)H dehydrogenase (quinone)